MGTTEDDLVGARDLVPGELVVDHPASTAAGGTGSAGTLRRVAHHGTYPREHYGLPRLFVHAWRLRFFHALTGHRAEVRAPSCCALQAWTVR